MLKIWNKLWQSNLTVAVLAGLSVVLAFPMWNLVFPLLAFPFLIEVGLRRCTTLKRAFLFGYLVSFVVSIGGFYWVTYVIHEFGYVPWSVAVLVFLGFCTFASLNFPVFTAALWYFQNKCRVNEHSLSHQAAWSIVGVPALFVVCEFFIPKLFPWFLGHSFHQLPLLIQIADVTGSIGLTYLVLAAGAGLALTCKRPLVSEAARWIVIPSALIVMTVGYGLYAFQRDAQTPKESLSVALIQANIGSLEKAASRKGAPHSIRHVMETYKRLTARALASTPRPELVLWPETAMPFPLDNPDSRYAKEIRESVLAWNTTLVTGGYARSVFDINRDHNTAFLFEPIGNGKLHEDLYHKNILLAFGEYLPLGETFPKLYEWAPQVSNFKRGEAQNAFTIGKGTRLGVTICYEAIVPAFYRKVVASKVNAVLNLTNDSWFGPTAEPYLHGALTIFRAVENRVPLLRVTNTGSSFVVDTLGRTSRMTPVYQEDILTTSVGIPTSVPTTPYQMLQDWFVILSAAITAGFAVLFLKYAPLPH